MMQLSVNEVARLKGVSARTVYRAVAEGRIVANRVGRAVLIDTAVAHNWSPMVTKARPQVRTDAGLATTLEAVLGFTAPAGSRHVGLALPDAPSHQRYLERLIHQASKDRAALTIVSATLEPAAIERLIGDAQAKGATSQVRVPGADRLQQEWWPSRNPAALAGLIRDLLTSQLTPGIEQTWLSIEMGDGGRRYVDREQAGAWRIFEGSMTRMLRHLPAIAICTIVGEPGMKAIAGFASCHPVCVLGGDSGFAIEASPITPA